MIKPMLFGLFVAVTIPCSHAFTYVGGSTNTSDGYTARPTGSITNVTSSDLVFTGNIAGGSGLPVGFDGSSSWITGDRSTGPTSHYGEVTYTVLQGYAINSFGFLPNFISLNGQNPFDTGSYNISLDVKYQINGSGAWYSHTLASNTVTGSVGDNFTFYFPSLDLEAPASTLTLRVSNLQLNHVGGSEIFGNSWTINSLQLRPGDVREAPAIPEPAAASLGLLGFAALFSKRRRA